MLYIVSFRCFSRGNKINSTAFQILNLQLIFITSTFDKQVTLSSYLKNVLVLYNLSQNQ